ncbi:membrane protein [Gordoniibacillus kamchatkensis]|uniref:Membrane protein n=1 Tax=Gordoniibacillus kamchatkensis TaxID=1590651 RepID=A0ABR5ACP3_9BACL|nr:DMT family transporter [Paenibacillus sp. VKM B-2647]KIL38794.1 membrane protein [Paenibacillus sp. VKM B-2647]
MLAFSLLLVICSGLAHAIWNFLAKTHDDKAAFLWIILVPSNAILLVYAALEIARKGLPWEGIVLAILSMTVQGLYASLLTHTYKMGDLSQVYPIMRGTSTLLVPIIGVVFLSESLHAYGWAGIVCMIAGFAVMSGWSPRSGDSGIALKPLLLALSVGLCTTSYTLIDKMFLQYLSPLSLLGIANIGFMAGITRAVLPFGRVRRVWRQHRATVLIGSLLSPGSYLLFLFAMEHAPVSNIAPLREVGIVFGTLLGLLFLKERHHLRRLAASAVIVAGIFLIAVLGTT